MNTVCPPPTKVQAASTLLSSLLQVHPLNRVSLTPPTSWLPVCANNLPAKESGQNNQHLKVCAFDKWKTSWPFLQRLQGDGGRRAVPPPPSSPSLFSPPPSFHHLWSLSLPLPQSSLRWPPGSGLLLRWREQACPVSRCPHPPGAHGQRILSKSCTSSPDHQCGPFTGQGKLWNKAATSRKGGLCPQGLTGGWKNQVHLDPVLGAGRSTGHVGMQGAGAGVPTSQRKQEHTGAGCTWEGVLGGGDCMKKGV